MSLILKLIVLPALYLIFIKIMTRQHLLYRPAIRKVMRNCTKVLDEKLNIPIFVIYTLQLCLITLVLVLIPYADRSLSSFDHSELLMIVRGLDLGFVIGGLIILSLLEYFWSYLKRHNGPNREYLYGTVVMIFCLAQLGMMYLYGTLSLEEIIVNQQVSQSWTILSFGFVRNPILFLGSILLVLLYFQNLQKNDKLENHNPVAPLGLLARELTFICVCVVIVYLYFGGHALPVSGEFVSNSIPPTVKLILQALVLVIKSSIFVWCIAKLTRRLVYRTDFFQSKLMMTVITPMAFFGLVVMPLIQFWSQL